MNTGLNTGLSAVELQHCREAAFATGGLFEFTSRYLPADRFEEYLALYAIVQIIQVIPTAHVDEEVIWAKLKWWREELAAEADSVSRHPVSRALWASGARSKIDQAMLEALLSGSVRSIDLAPDSDENFMFERLATPGSVTIEVELALDDVALDDVTLDSECVRYLGAASGVFEILSGFGKDSQQGFDRIPLNLLAEFDLIKNQLAQQKAALALVIAQLASFGLEWFSQGFRGLAGLKESRAGQHLQLRWAMENRRLEKIKNNAGGFLESGNRFGPADAWFAWRFLRRLK
ncbi:MAG: hypothetical protein GQ538_05330 [Xanthomonadales bacterium]|nr:hypothetical protein [Xanthomonadales bacterium]